MHWARWADGYTNRVLLPVFAVYALHIYIHDSHMPIDTNRRGSNYVQHWPSVLMLYNTSQMIHIYRDSENKIMCKEWTKCEVLYLHWQDWTRDLFNVRQYRLNGVLYFSATYTIKEQGHFWHCAYEVSAPKVILGVTQQLNKCHQCPPRMWSMDNEAF